MVVKLGVFLCLALATTRVSLASAGETIAYVEDFENLNPVKFWTAKGDYKVNFAGLTTERSHGGKQSFKLDITFLKDGDYNYWCGPTLDIPVAPGVRFSGHIYLEQVPPNVSVGLGTSYYVPALRVTSGADGRGVCNAIGSLGSSAAGRWIEQNADVYTAGTGLAAKVVGEPTPGIRLEKWSIQITCRNAVDARLVLYVDDISIEGVVPENWAAGAEQHLRDWEIAYRGRQAVSREAFEAALKPLHDEAIALQRAIPGSAIVDRAPEHPWRDHARQLRLALIEHAAALLKRTDPTQALPTDVEMFLHDLRDAHLRPLRVAIENLKKIVRRREPCLLFVQNDPITNYRNLPQSVLVDGELRDDISIFGSPGEYIPAGILVRPARNTTVTMRVSDLRRGEAVISADQLDLRVVKVWYQAGYQVSETNKHVLTPELLLYDDRLVEVDSAAKRNMVRDLDAPRDAETLQPVDIAADEVRQFWLTVHVPDGAAPGKYSGTLTVECAGLPARELKLQIEVLPIELAASYLDYGIYYRGQLIDAVPGVVNSDHKTPRQLEAEFRNLKAHGILWPDVYQKFEPRLLDAYLDLKEKAGLPVDPLYYLGVGTAGDLSTPAKVAERLELVRQVLTYARSRGIERVYFYGQDEAMGDALKSQRQIWQAIHQLGGKIWVACSPGFFDLVGDLLDLPVVARQSPAEVPRVQALGRKIWNYSKPGAIEAPFSQRYFMGLWLVKSGMDGSHTYAYQHAQGPGKAMGRPWDDFDDANYRAINYTYPTVDGVVDTLQWEAVREAVDDVRYLSTLRRTIAEAKDSGKVNAVHLAEQAQTWLNDLDITGDLHALRRALADRIIELQNTMGP